MKVLLLATNTLRNPYPVYPLGIDYVAGAISPPHQVDVVDLCAEDAPGGPNGPHGIEARIREFGPDIVGLSLRNVDTSDSTNAKDFTARVTDVVSLVRRATHAPVVLGGSAFSIFPDEFMQTLGAEYGIIGEGERLALLLNAMEKGDDASGLPGVIVKGKKKSAAPALWDGSITRTFDQNRPYVGFYLKNGGMLNLQTKRGCPLDCIYCTYPLIDGKGVRCFDPASVGRTARELQDAGAKFLYVADSSFNVHSAHSMAVAEEFVRNGVRIPWGGFFTPKPMPPGYYRKMAECGLTHVEFGTDSLCDDVLSSYRKPFRLEHVLESHRQAVEAGLFVSHYLLLGGPGETPNTLKKTLDAADALEKTVIFFFFGMRIYPGTELDAMAQAEGKAEYRDTFASPVFYQASAVGHKAVAEAVRKKARGRLNWIVGSGGEVMDRTVTRMHSRGDAGPLWENLIG